MRVHWTDLCCTLFGAALVGIIYGVYAHDFGPHFQGYATAATACISAFGVFRYFENEKNT